MLKPTNLFIFTVPEEAFISIPLDKLRMLLATTLHFTMEATADEKYNFCLIDKSELFI